MENYVVTIARGFGSGGKAIAMGLAEQLGIECYEHRLLALASENTGLDENMLNHYDEKIHGSMLINKLGKAVSELGLRPMTGEFRANQHMFDIQTKIIRELVKSQSCIIVGKCADYILRDMPNVVSVYIEAPREYCRKRIMDRKNVTAEEADELISATDKYRAEYYSFYTNGQYWTNPINYDMTLNSARVGHEQCIEVIKNYLQMKGFV